MFSQNYNRDDGYSDGDSAQNVPKSEQLDERIKQLAPKGQDKIELFDYLTNTMSLDI